jgi:hypothetical protein
MKTIIKLLCIPLLFIGMSCSVEPLADTSEDLNSLTFKGKKNGDCDRFKNRPSSNTYVGIEDDEFYGTWSYPIGAYTGISVITGFEDNGDGTFTQTSRDEVIAENGDLLITLSTVLIVPSSETAGTYTATFTVDGGDGIFEGATGRFKIKNGVYNELGAFHNAKGKITSFGLCDD